MESVINIFIKKYMLIKVHHTFVNNVYFFYLKNIANYKQNNLKKKKKYKMQQNFIRHEMSYEKSLFMLSKTLSQSTLFIFDSSSSFYFSVKIFLISRELSYNSKIFTFENRDMHKYFS